jgi:hypothetical protein
MSAKLLLGIGILGVGWVALGSSRAKSADAAGLSQADVLSGPAVGDVGDPQNETCGVTAVAAQVDNGTAGVSILGGAPVAGQIPDPGQANKQTALVDFQGPSGEPGVGLRNELSTGGADPSTLGTAVGAAIATPKATGVNGFINPGDMGVVLQRVAYGDSGADGVPVQQWGRKYMELGKLTGEVW